MFEWESKFPGTPRPGQAEILNLLSAEWNNFDAFIIAAPPGAGKSAIAATLMAVHHNVSYIVPTNQLLSQVRSSYPQTSTLERLDSYHCPRWDRPCSVTRGKCRSFCPRGELAGAGFPPCPAGSALATAKYKRGPILSNFHTYLAQSLHRDLLIVDEAHLLQPLIAERNTKFLWRSKYKYPHNMWRVDQILAWVKSRLASGSRDRKLKLVEEALVSAHPRHIVTRGLRPHRGFDQDCLVVEPVDVSDAAPVMWPAGQTKKLVLMSATISKIEVEALGVAHRFPRILYLECESVITPDRRPVIPLNVCALTYSNLAEVAPRIAEEIQAIAAHHADERGLVHATYKLASLLHRHLGHDPRFIFHTRETRIQAYEQFRKSSGNPVLIACGMYEGIDLPGDLSRWQVITKIPWKSLASPAIRYLSEQHTGWYVWEAVKTTIQACGRIVRGPEDWGITYVIDKTWTRMYNEGCSLGVIPQGFQDAVRD